MGYSYAGSVIAVTGGAGGIAAAFIGPAASLGASIAVIDVRGPAAEATAAALPGGGTHRGYACDLTDEAQVQRLIERLAADYGRIDVLVNNVGMTSSERFDERSTESIRREIDVNMVSPLILTRLAIPLLRRSRDPRVVTTVSLGSIIPLGETPIYTASKFGLRGAMLAIGLDLAGKGIRAGSVMPSATDTRMLRQEAIDGGNSLQFQDQPQQPATVAAAIARMLDKPRLEIYPRRGESVLVRIAMLVPNLLPRLMGRFRRKGERGMAAYLLRLERDGHVVRVDGELRLADERIAR